MKIWTFYFISKIVSLFKYCCEEFYKLILITNTMEREMKNLIVILLSFLINLYKYYNFKVHAIKQKKFSFLEFKHLTKISFQFIYLYGSNILFSQNVKRSARDQIQFDSVDITENATRIYIADCNTDNVLSCKGQNRRKQKYIPYRNLERIISCFRI